MSKNRDPKTETTLKTKNHDLKTETKKTDHYKDQNPWPKNKDSKTKTQKPRPKNRNHFKAQKTKTQKQRPLQRPKASTQKAPQPWASTDSRVFVNTAKQSAAATSQNYSPLDT